jgi:hypothetical protein
MKSQKRNKLFNVELWQGKRHLSTIKYQLPYGLAKHIKDIELGSSKLPSGSYIKLVEK